MRSAQVFMATKFCKVALGIRGSQSGAQNFEMSPRFLENFRTPALNYICSCRWKRVDHLRKRVFFLIYVTFLLLVDAKQQ
jgi:hypothetical protein